MANKRDYYEVLEVPREADEREIKRAYRKLAVRLHPDKNPGDKQAEEQFKEAAEAYAVLSDPDKRAQYDRFGHQMPGGGGFGGFDPSVFGDFSDILGDLFGFGGGGGGRRGGGRRPSRGADLRYDLTLTFEEAAFGVDKTLRIPRLETCGECAGQGSEDGRTPPPCQACGGSGQLRMSQGFFTVARTCPECRGEGAKVVNPCKRCHGQGLVERQRDIQVSIPAGVDTGARLRLTGEGEHGRLGGPQGDLYVVLKASAHELFMRDGAEVSSTVDLTYAQAVLGSSITVETLHGEETLDVPGGTQPGHQFRLRGKGIARLGRGGQGDHLVRVRLVVPKPGKLEEEQVELLRKLAELEGSSVREGRGVMDKVKDLFG